MPVNIGPLVIKAQVDREAFQEDVAAMLEGISLEELGTDFNPFEDLHEKFQELFEDMINLEQRSKSMQIVVGAAFDLLAGTMNSVATAWQEMLLVGEISWATFGEAMKAMVAQELAAISASALVNALYATAIGLLRLASFMPGAAASAFAAAATFAAVAAIAGAGALALAPKGGGGYGDEGGYDEFGPSGGQTDQIQSRNNQRYLNLTIQGNILGNEEFVREQLLPQINALVQEDDAVIVTSNRANTSRNIR